MPNDSPPWFPTTLPDALLEIEQLRGLYQREADQRAKAESACAELEARLDACEAAARSDARSLGYWANRESAKARRLKRERAAHLSVGVWPALAALRAENQRLREQLDAKQAGAL